MNRVWRNKLTIRELDHINELLMLQGAWKDVLLESEINGSRKPKKKGTC